MAREFFDWQDTTGDEDTVVVWDAQRIAKEFHLERDEHIGITILRGIETAVAASADLFLLADIARGNAREGVTPFKHIEESPVGTRDRVRTDRGGLWINADSSDTHIPEDRPTEMVEILETLTFSKTTAHIWLFSVDYLVLEGAMRWPSEDFMKDIRKVGRLRTAGRPFFQVGDTRVLFEQN